MRRSKERTSEKPTTAKSLARRIGCDAKDLVEALGLLNATEDVFRAIQGGVGDIYLHDLPEEFHVPLARIIGTVSGPHRELFWATEDAKESVFFATFGDANAWAKAASLRSLLPPRIFATDTTIDSEGREEARDLIRVHDTARLTDPVLRRASHATEVALRIMRPAERNVLLGRLRGKRGTEETTWGSLASNPSDKYRTGSVALTKEIFKVALSEFLQEYAKATDSLIG